MKCPLSASQYGDLATCVKTDCIFADAAGECLVKQALTQNVLGWRKKKLVREKKFKELKRFLEQMKGDGYSDTN